MLMWDRGVERCHGRYKLMTTSGCSFITSPEQKGDCVGRLEERDVKGLNKGCLKPHARSLWTRPYCAC